MFIYHSNCDEVGIVGLATIARKGYPDHTAFDPMDRHYDPKGDPKDPRWHMVDVRYKLTLRRTIRLSKLKRHQQLAGMPLVRKGNRFCVMPVTKQQSGFMLRLE